MPSDLLMQTYTHPFPLNWDKVFKANQMTTKYQTSLVRLTELDNTGLLIEAVYQSGRVCNASDEPVPPFLVSAIRASFDISALKICPV